MLKMLFAFSLVLVALVSEVFTYPRVLLLSFDGFHRRYMTNDFTPYLYNTLWQLSAGPPYMTTVFPSKTFVTHFSLSTGVYPEVHGVYGNRMFDSKGEVMHNDKNQFQTNPSIIPIWIENQKNGKHSGVMMWPGSDFKYGEVTPTYHQAFDKSMLWGQRVAKIIEWMKSPTNKPNLVMAYFEDEPCNDKSRKAQHLKEHLINVDNTIKEIYEKLKTEITDGDIDLIILSDHGTLEVESDKILKINDYIEANEDTKIIVSGPVVYIKPKPEKLIGMISQLEENELVDITHTVHTKDTLDESYKLGTSNLDGIIVLIAKYGYTFYENSAIEQLHSDIGSDNVIVEENGYDSLLLNMNAFFLAIGKTFRKDITLVNSFNITDVYPLLKKLLDLPSEASDVQKNIKIDKNVHILFEECDVTQYNVDVYTKNTRT